MQVWDAVEEMLALGASVLVEDNSGKSALDRLVQTCTPSLHSAHSGFTEERATGGVVLDVPQKVSIVVHSKVYKDSGDRQRKIIDSFLAAYSNA